MIKMSLSLKWLFVLVPILLSCSGKNNNPSQDEQIRITALTDSISHDSTVNNSIRGDLTLKQIDNYPNRIILTGLAQHRLVPVYRKPGQKQRQSEYSSYKSYDYDPEESEYQEHFMPGVDLLFGYNLLNVAHYDLAQEKLNFLFEHPVLVKSLYFPSYEQDSLNKKPINRDYYLVSAFDEDTNRDSLINRLDLRRFYSFDASGSGKVQIIPANYSVVRSQYDAMNDIMYVFATHDANNNGKVDKAEPLHVFWLSLKKPGPAKRLY